MNELKLSSMIEAEPRQITIFTVSHARVKFMLTKYGFNMDEYCNVYRRNCCFVVDNPRGNPLLNNILYDRPFACSISNSQNYKQLEPALRRKLLDNYSVHVPNFVTDVTGFKVRFLDPMEEQG